MYMFIVGQHAMYYIYNIINGVASMQQFPLSDVLVGYSTVLQYYGIIILYTKPIILAYTNFAYTFS